MWDMFLPKKRENNADTKSALMSVFFDFSTQKKVIRKAARESAQDQKALIKEYHRLHQR